MRATSEAATTAGTTSPRVRARRTETRARILAAAWELAGEVGVGQLTLRELAARVGMRAPSLYGYFPSKDAIYDAMFAEGWQRLDDELRAFLDGLDDDLPAAERLAAATRWGLASLASDWARYQLLFTRVVPGWVPSDDAYAAAVAHYQRLASALADVGLTDPADVDLYTAITAGLLAQHFANDPDGDRYLGLADTATEMFVAHLQRKAHE